MEPPSQTRKPMLPEFSISRMSPAAKSTSSSLFPNPHRESWALSFSEKWQGPSTEIILKLRYCKRFRCVCYRTLLALDNGKDVMTDSAICRDKLRLVALYEQATRT